jgi:hypothetical protein
VPFFQFSHWDLKVFIDHGIEPENPCAWLVAVLWIRIRFHFGRLDPDPHWENGSGSRRAEMTQKSEENSNFEVLDVLFGGM